MLNDNLPSKAEMIERLYRCDVREYVKHRPQSGQQLAYLEWHVVNRLLDELTAGNWDGYVVAREMVADRLVVTYRLVLNCADGPIIREATGGEDEDVKGYGDVASNAEAMAFKRAAARCGLGLSLYAKDGDARRPIAQPARSPAGATSDREALIGEYKVAWARARRAGLEPEPVTREAIDGWDDDKLRRETRAMVDITAAAQKPA